MGEQVYLANFLLLSFNEFNAILGLSWLTMHNAIVDCRSRTVHLASSEGNEILLMKKVKIGS